MATSNQLHAARKAKRVLKPSEKRGTCKEEVGKEESFDTHPRGGHTTYPEGLGSLATPL